MPPTRPPPRLAVAPPMERRGGAGRRGDLSWSMRMWVVQGETADDVERWW